MPLDTTLNTIQTTPPQSGDNIINEELVVGSTTDTFTLQSEGSDAIVLGLSGLIQVGTLATENNIELNGGVNYYYKALSDTGTSYNVTDNDYMIEVKSSTYININLPQINNGSVVRSGRQYIISRGFATSATALNIVPFAGDTIDGLSSCQLYDEDIRINIIADDTGKWLIL